MKTSDVTVALFGDCVTHTAAEVYRHTRAVGLTSWLPIISPASENFLRLTQEMLDETSMRNYYKRICLLNSNKKFLDYLLEEKADYLILDCNDCRKELIYDSHASVGKEACITNNWSMPDFKEYLKMIFGSQEGYKSVPCTDIDRKFYEHAVEQVCNELKKVYKTEQIIINKHYYVDTYIDDKGIHHYKRTLSEESDEAQELVRYLETLLEKQLEGCHVIEFPDNVFGDPKHRFGLGPLHYHSLYYEYVRVALEIIFQKIPEEKLWLKQLQDSYSMRFKLLRLEMLDELKTRMLKLEIQDEVISKIQGQVKENAAVLGRWGTTDAVATMLLKQNDICDYLDALYMLRDKIIILMAVKDTSGFYDDSIMLRKLKRLGFTNFPSKLWWMYAGVVFRGTTLLNLAADEAEMPVQAEQLIGNKKIILKSESWRKGNLALIEIDGIDYSVNRRGINLVVCNASDGNILDAVSYDSHSMESFFRKE